MTATMQNRSETFVQASDVPLETVGEGITRQILSYGPDLMLCRLWFEAGSVGDVHQHPHGQISYIESGRFLSFVNGEEQELDVGDSVIISPDTDHGISCIEAGSLLDIFNPVREDFLATGEDES
ncbi:cupin domain-containing protein [Sphingorhabdus sp. YGSMI21]|uniref:cupin domain-containing protein n=1 Tax=Sphingorhabdus sp. YGSMI21 TaxID=2077182 RepID=UPI0019803B5C|nr:cupin domain-containing protein [Sphingorhabdus sp. YGSMI21]